MSTSLTWASNKLLQIRATSKVCLKVYSRQLVPESAIPPLSNPKQERSPQRRPHRNYEELLLFLLKRKHGSTVCPWRYRSSPRDAQTGWSNINGRGLSKATEKLQSVKFAGKNGMQAELMPNSLHCSRGANTTATTIVSGIFLFSIIDKLFASIMLHRLQTLTERTYHDTQGGFHSQGSTVDFIFSVWQLQGKCIEQKNLSTWLS